MGEEDSNDRRGALGQVSAKIKSGYTRAAGSPITGVLAAIFIGLLTVVLIWRFKPHAPPYTKPKQPLDPTAVITTFITLYGLFIGGFGVLIGFVVKKKVKKPERLTAWRIAAIWLLILGFLMDLWRVYDSTSDLFIATASGLDYLHLKDDINDFRIYFSSISLSLRSVLGLLSGPRPRNVRLITMSDHNAIGIRSTACPKVTPPGGRIRGRRRGEALAAVARMV
jgi:hypothetical protein